VSPGGSQIATRIEKGSRGETYWIGAVGIADSFELLVDHFVYEASIVDKRRRE